MLRALERGHALTKSKKSAAPGKRARKSAAASRPAPVKSKKSSVTSKASRRIKVSEPIAAEIAAPQVDGEVPNRFHIVGLGGSAGGLEALGQFFDHLPPDTGMAYVVVAHLDPQRKGMLVELLQRHTHMSVTQASDDTPVVPNSVYVIPPNHDLSVLHGTFHLLDPSQPRGLRMPIDFFFRQLADDQKEMAVCVVLSGMGTDGTLGLRAVKENFGMAMVQDPSSARYDSMPHSAVETGLADVVAVADYFPARLVAYSATLHHAYTGAGRDRREDGHVAPEDLRPVARAQRPGLLPV